LLAVALTFPLSRFPAFKEHPRMTPLAGYLLLSAMLFAIGLAGALTRRNAIIVLIGIELMLNAANLNFIAFWRFSEHPEALTGILFVIFSIGVAAAEAAVGLALIIAIYRHYKTTNVDEVKSLKG
jgi:NADH:ubiquinone oxidoreductase subunit K